MWQSRKLRQILVPIESADLCGVGFTGCWKVSDSVILSGAKNLSFFVFLLLDRREILRSAQNDKNGEFFRDLFSLWG
jgi:hypothetical protein